MSLELFNISQGYGSSRVITDLNLELNPGVIGLLGPNGAGKTTLMRTISTINPPQSGRIVFGGHEVNGERAARAARRQIGYLPQHFGYDPGMTVYDFVRYAAWLRGLPRRQWNDAADKAIAQVELQDSRRTRMKKLSGGMRQRAGIAWAVVGSPKLIILDEPTVGLDPRQRIQFRKIISTFSESIVLLSTHLTDDIDAVCDRVMVLHDGALRFNGTTDALSALGNQELPGNSALERAYMSLLPAGERDL